MEAAEGLALIGDKASIPLIIEACRKAPGQGRAVWMKTPRWGVMTHYPADLRACADGEANELFFVQTLQEEANAPIS